MIITFDLLCHANFSLADDSDFHCGECCFISTSYPQTHRPTTHSNLFHKVLIHFIQHVAKGLHGGSASSFSKKSRNDFCGDMVHAQMFSRNHQTQYCGYSDISTISLIANLLI